MISKGSGGKIRKGGRENGENCIKNGVKCQKWIFKEYGFAWRMSSLYENNTLRVPEQFKLSCLLIRQRSRIITGFVFKQ